MLEQMELAVQDIQAPPGKAQHSPILGDAF
jgi:hypothetical protein